MAAGLVLFTAHLDGRSSGRWCILTRRSDMNNSRNTLIRTLHDVGAAAWFGGSLMGATGLNGATKDISDPTERAAVAASGWARWSPIAATAIAAHAIGGIGLIIANRDRVAQQSGVGANTAIKAAVTIAAVATTAASGLLGAQLAKDAKDSPVPAEGGTVPSAATPAPAAKRQQALRILQWVNPVLTGVVVALGAQQGEQQKAGQVLAGKARQTLGGAVSALR